MKTADLVSGPKILVHQTLPSFSIPEWAEVAGYHGVILDLQHGELGVDAACGILRSIPRHNAYAWARVGSTDPGPILRLLDSGARGIVAPTIESREQAQALVAATKYLPVGNRSMGPSRPGLYIGDSYAEAGNLAVSTIAQIETRIGVERAEEIISTPGLDSIYIGPADLAVSYGLPGRGDWDDGPVRDAIVHLRKLTRAHGVTLGIYSGKSAYTAALLADGLVDYVAFGIDLVLLNRALGDNINELKTALSTRNRS
ncbi:HpcH/HpaI aldolase family protein [Pandoraea soli]|uniref:2-dehydro-3,6-dideoxy-6-sulfogluconate aldolase n=1 Tax=Pandoraea soli TaxID=2508293 RepID=A0ABY6W1Z0_9BURK|nr:aldolase/citrate lyase family protein [Pandoraea soli]VVE16665.1 2-dehydro-3,6-dideoxy-6-sulfogluconate aldolase [Pandoraea soli]